MFTMKNLVIESGMLRKNYRILRRTNWPSGFMSTKTISAALSVVSRLFTESLIDAHKAAPVPLSFLTGTGPANDFAKAALVYNQVLSSVSKFDVKLMFKFPYRPTYRKEYNKIKEPPEPAYCKVGFRESLWLRNGIFSYQTRCRCSMSSLAWHTLILLISSARLIFRFRISIILHIKNTGKYRAVLCQSERRISGYFSAVMQEYPVLDTGTWISCASPIRRISIGSIKFFL